MAPPLLRPALPRRPLAAWALLGRLARWLSVGAAAFSLWGCSDGGPQDGSGAGQATGGATGSAGDANGTGGGGSASSGGGAAATGGAGVDGTGSSGGQAGTGGTGAVVLPPNEIESCKAPDTTETLLAEQAVNAYRPIPTVLYTWTTEEQEQGLRSGDPLYSVGEVEGLGRGIAMDALVAQSEASPDGLEKLVADLFLTNRYAWTNPWATRMGFGSEDYGNRLVRIELRDDAWIGVLSAYGTIAEVYDLAGETVSLEEAMLTPERIAALFFKRQGNGGPYCGSFLSGDGGYREFVLGNESMVKRWELGSDAIVERLQQDIDALTEYLDLVRPCPPGNFGQSFNAEVTCLWGSLNDPYLESLALPGPAYVPTAANIATIIETLTGDLFTPDPFIVEQP